MRRRVTRRALTMIGIAGLLFLAATTAQAGWLFVLSAGVLGLVASSLFVRHRLRQIDVVRKAPRRVRVGDNMQVVLEIRNTGRTRSPLLRLEDRFAATDPFVALVEPVAAGASAFAETPRVATRRGAFTGGDVTVSSGAPFGFVRTTRTSSVATETVVVPRWVELRSFPILEPSSAPMDVLHERARTGAGAEYIGVREYRPGDPRRAVHWRSTARAGKLIVREFEEEVATRVSLVLAGADAGDPPDSAYEVLASAAASIGAYAIQTGHPVDAVRSDDDGPRRLVEPDRGSLLEWLAHAQPVDHDLQRLAETALGRPGRRSTVVFLTPSTGDAAASVGRAVQAVQAAGSRAVVVCAQSASWDPKAGALGDDAIRAAVGARAPLRLIHKGGELARCLEL